MHAAILYTILNPENKLLIEAAQARGVELHRLVDSELSLELTAPSTDYDVILQRSSSYARTLYSSFYYEQAGALVLNPYRAHQLCGDKFLSSTLLAKANIPTPRTYSAFTPPAATHAAAQLHFPLVMKPVFGSWARMVHKINDREALEAGLESREEMGHAFQKVYYLQEHIDKPGRDIRAFVVGNQCIAAIYRHSTEKSGWITNTGRGGTASKCEVTPELAELAVRAANVFGEGIYGVDLMESSNGLVVHEVNHTTEFRNSIEPTGVDIPGKMIDYFISRAKR
jgi:[lysine-biosynthesis-protein LysW]--L-2-aminoadipate ligase